VIHIRLWIFNLSLLTKYFFLYTVLYIDLLRLIIKFLHKIVFVLFLKIGDLKDFRINNITRLILTFVLSLRKEYFDKKILNNSIYVYIIYDGQICSLLQTIDINLHMIISVRTLYV